MVFDLAFVVLGLVILLAAGDALVRGAVGLASMLGIPVLVIGLTIVAFGTSAPELVVSIQAVLNGNNGIAIGNIVGSNIANILLVLGLPAMFAAISLDWSGLKRHAAVMLIATGLFAFVVYQHGILDTTMGVLMLAAIAVYIAYIAITAMASGKPDPALLEEVEEIAGGSSGGTGKTILFLVAGLIGLPLGAHFLVTHGADLARELNVREEIIGLTIVAFGTSLPELATVWAAAMKREAEVAVGNVVGSNIFNILFVGGATGLVGQTTFGEATRTIDVPVMAASAVVLALMIFAKSKISRALGAVFAILYVGYIIFTGMSAGGPAL
ncbi:calcium/sodium antiporter [Parvularcula sp. LCG005]|uniref:calcium/sodium antiporter n=1 Tax=Parvularcula sp. LCG005 TaxID=3078805 RepID=UPI002942466B|nr:calcium/sodium antiporter [Parvularcula sp. LCG005]WOI54183.1 calcium/sodium antiporter [Parvularcula sp. LCG005]